MKLFLVLSEAYHGKLFIKQNYKYVFDAFLLTIHVNTFQRITTDISALLEQKRQKFNGSCACHIL